jgi:hypothetical protein
MNWENALVAAHRELVETKNTREIGKIRAAANEHLQQSWVDENTKLDVRRRVELSEDSKLLEDHNESGWDMICAHTQLRLQSKYRGGKTAGWLHLEQTRRNSKKNQGKASASGHVVYRDDEFDVLVVTRPVQFSMECYKEDLIVMPVEALKDPKNPGYLYKVVPKKVWSVWQKKDPVAVLNDLFREALEAGK